MSPSLSLVRKNKNKNGSPWDWDKVKIVLPLPLVVVVVAVEQICVRNMKYFIVSTIITYALPKTKNIIIKTLSINSSLPQD